MLKPNLLSLLTSCLVACSAATYAQGTFQSSNATATIPSATDSRISTFNQPHMSWLPTVQPRNQLLVFLPGTGGQPRERFPFSITAAGLGYNVISLMYPDGVAAQQACANSSDPDAYMKFRLAIIQGGDMGPLGPIPEAESIENRLTQLLRYLASNQADGGWGQFLDKNGQIDWSKVTISGQSQGGGHAYVISKIHKVARVITFGSPKDFSFYFNEPAKGFDGNTKTPLNRYFAFNHMQDNLNGCNHDQQLRILEQIGLTRLGTANADHASANYDHAHLIYSDIPLSDPHAYHSSVINGSLPVCVPVWKYLLTEPAE
jgi:hypothetical protein